MWETKSGSKCKDMIYGIVLLLSLSQILSLLIIVPSPH
jgi:hypothetical protein